MRKFSKTYRYPLIGFALVAVLFGSLIIFRARQSTGDGESVAVVKRGAVREEVNVTGKVKPLEQADLSFERGGTVRRVLASTGDKVARGQALISLDTRTDELRLAEALAGEASAAAKLAELRRGTRREDIAIAEAKYGASESSLATARESLLVNLKDAFTRSDSAVHSSVDQFLSNPRSVNVKINFLVVNNELEKAFLTGRISVEAILVRWQASSEMLHTNDPLRSIEETYSNLRGVQKFLELAAELVNNLSASSQVSQTVADGYRDDVATARTSVNTALTNLATADDVWRKASTAYVVEGKNLEKARAGSSSEEITAQEAEYAKVSASVASIRNDISEATLRAPFSGRVTDEDATEGERISAYTTLMSVAELSALEIEANVPEVDIGRIAVNNPVEILFDAFSGEKFAGKVSSIDPAETIIDGVVNFRITVVLTVPDERIRSGLTANLTIQTVEKKDVLTLPGVALVETDEGVFVRRAGEANDVLVSVVIGTRGNDGTVEIVSGLAEGDKVEVVGLRTQ